MDFSDPRQRAAFFDVHHDLPREGPGDRVSTLRALALAAPLPERPRVLDIACGPGAQTLDLAAALPEASIVAVDAHAPYLDELNRRAAAAGSAGRIKTVRGDMAALDFPPAAFDLIWCEGAAYIMGVADALRAAAAAAAGGKLALTDAVWLRPDPPGPVLANWAEYPAMRDVAGVRARFEQAGYALLGDFVLPEQARWAGYYGPLEARLSQLARRRNDDPVARTVMDEVRAEIDCYRRYSNFFGYAFFVAAVVPWR